MDNAFDFESKDCGFESHRGQFFSLFFSFFSLFSNSFSLFSIFFSFSHSFPATCQTLINHCFSSPCLNNALCADLHLNYKCICEPGYTGDRCQTELDECLSKPCHQGSTCVDLPKAYSCTCDQGWTGENCGSAIQECNSDPCKNNGYGVVLQKCHKNGWNGRKWFKMIKNWPFQSQYDLKLHVLAQKRLKITFWPNNDRILHQNTIHFRKTTLYCTEPGTGVFECSCEPGFTGKSCELEANPCSSMPCKNLGNCEKVLPTVYSCECGIGFQGADCGMVIDYCESLPCSHDSVCEIERASDDTGLQILYSGGFAEISRTGKKIS